MSLTVHVPDELARRLEAVAASRQLTPEQVVLEAIEARVLPETVADALEAFIGSGDSGDPTWAGRDTHELRAEVAARAG